MPHNRWIVWAAAALLAWGRVQQAVAQQHRARNLGNPATRFAPPRHSPDDVRALFRHPDLRPDIASIVRQAGWAGRLEDLYQAAESAPIAEISLPVGTRMPFMASRAHGKPVALLDVLWAGQGPVRAYAFHLTSAGRRYRCVVPAPCSNFYLEDLGPEPPKLDLQKVAPARASVCEPFEVRIIVRNTSAQPLTQVRVADALPAGLQVTDGQTVLELNAGNLQPGHGMQFRIPVQARAAGTYTNTATAMCTEGAQAQATARIEVHAPTLTLECEAPAEAQAGRPVEVCLTLRNTGSAAEPEATLTLTAPENATALQAGEGTVSSNTVRWKGLALGPGETRRLCAVFAAAAAGELAFSASAQGRCAPPAESRCTTRSVGVPGVLLEVVDLEDPIEVSNRVVYVIKVLNQGSVPLTNLRLACTLPEGQQLVGGSGATAVQADGASVRMEPLASLAPKAEVSWRVETLATAPGDVRFYTRLQCDQFERPVEETEATRQY